MSCGKHEEARALLVQFGLASPESTDKEVVTRTKKAVEDISEWWRGVMEFMDGNAPDFANEIRVRAWLAE